METIEISSLFTIKMNGQHASFQKIGTTWWIVVTEGCPRRRRQAGWGAWLCHRADEGSCRVKISKALMLLFSVTSCLAAVNPEVSESSVTAGASADKEDTGEGASVF